MGLGVKSSDGDAELGSGFQHPYACNLEGQVLPVGPLDEPVEDRIIEYPPPVAVF